LKPLNIHSETAHELAALKIAASAFWATVALCVAALPFARKL
jgi:hypothetical protein